MWAMSWRSQCRIPHSLVAVVSLRNRNKPWRWRCICLPNKISERRSAFGPRKR